MADKSRIEWTDATWNPITGCTRVSSGCEHCYAERLAATRLRRHPSRRGLTDKHGRWTGEVRFNEKWIDQPLRWKRPRRVFVVAHGDLFHPSVPYEWIDRVFEVMLRARQHTYQVLTKRADRLWSYTAHRHGPLTGLPLPPHIWCGVSAEDRDALRDRMDSLQATPAPVRWLSLEPLLGPVGELYLRDRTIDWIVVGGESGPGWRPMDPDWVRDIRDQCRTAGVALYVKQMAGKAPIPQDLMIREWPKVVRHG